MTSGPPIYAELAANWQRYQSKTITQEDPMSVLTELEQELRQDAEETVTKIREMVDGKLSKLSGVAQAVDNSRLVQLALELSEVVSPELETVMVNVLNALASRPPVAAGEPVQPA